MEDKNDVEYTLEYVLQKYYLLKLEKEIKARNQVFRDIHIRFIGPTDYRIDHNVVDDRENFIWKHGRYFYDGNY